MRGKIMTGYDYTAFMNYMDPDVRFPKKAIKLACQSQSGVSLSLHLGSKMKMYLWPHNKLDMEEYRL